MYLLLSVIMVISTIIIGFDGLFGTPFCNPSYIQVIMVLTNQQPRLVMPRTHDAHWIGFQATGAEKESLENYCRQMQQTKTEVLRRLIKTLSYPPSERDHWLLQVELGASHSRIIGQYCQLTGLTPNEAIREAIQLLVVNEVMHLSPEDSKVFAKAINKPPEPNDKLKQLMQTKAPWEIAATQKYNKPIAIHSNSEIRSWLQSLADEAELDLTLAKQLRDNAKQMIAFGQHMLAVAEHLEER